MNTCRKKSLSKNFTLKKLFRYQVNFYKQKYREVIMPKKLNGTLVVLFIYVNTLCMFAITLLPGHVCAQLSELSEIQNGIFYLSHKNMGITSETFKSDKYIDDEQAEFFAEASKPKLLAPSDNNFPFTLIDHYVLNSDLKITYAYDTILSSAFPHREYLSIHNISIEDYTVQKTQPAYYITTIRGKDPFTGADSMAMQLEVKNAEVFSDEMLQKSVSPGSDCYSGYGENVYGKVISAKIAVWAKTTDTDLVKRCASPEKNSTCLHPSDIRPQPEPVRIIRLSPTVPCIAQPFLPEAPRSNCYYPLPAERTTRAATNWSYNYNLRNNSSATDLTNGTRPVKSQTADSTCQTCR